MSNIKISSEIHQSIRWDFPLFDSHKNLIYLDSTATTQKPAHVIDGVAEYLRTGYANIHRGSYELSEISEGLYEDSKKKVAQHIGAENWREIIYTSNSTYALNILAQSMRRTGILKKWDTVLVSIVEHHANIVPWLILKEDLGILVEFISIQADFTLDIEDLKSKLTPNVRAISLAHVSNTTGQIFDLEQVGKILQQEYSQKNKPLFIVDASTVFHIFKLMYKNSDVTLCSLRDIKYLQILELGFYGQRKSFWKRWFLYFHEEERLAA